MWEQIQNLERISDEYRKASGQDISDDILLSTLVRVLPRHIQQHVQLGMDDSSTLQQVRERVLAYGPVSWAWTRDRILVQKVGKGKLKGKSFDKGKQKGKPSYDKGKGKGKPQDKGKAGLVQRAIPMTFRRANRHVAKRQRLIYTLICSYCGNPVTLAERLLQEET